MKKRLSILRLLFVYAPAMLCAGILNAQTAAQNYIATWSPTAPISDPAVLSARPLSDVKLSIQYFDGAARATQTVIRQGSLITATGTKADIVTPVTYDNFQRDTADFLPYVATGSDGSYKTDALTAQPAFYNGGNSPVSGQGEAGANAHSKIIYESSPLGRVLQTMAPGNSWIGAGRSVQTKFWTNTATDAVRKWTVTFVATPGSGFGSYSSTSTYGAGQLYKNVTADENGRQVVTFTDNNNHILLKKVQLTAAADNGSGSSHTGWICTYYLYDGLNHLRCVIQPAAVQAMNTANNWTLTAIMLTDQCFRYEYDKRDRMIMKQVPGAGTSYMVYDARDRLVMNQDANMHTANNWLATMYDSLDRPQYTWTYNSATAFTTLLSAAATSISYPSASPPSSPALLTQTHYDDYASLPSGLSSSYITTWDTCFAATSTTTFPYPEKPAKNSATTTKGMVTWEQVKVIDSTPALYLPRVMIYDDKGRVIQVQSKNITGGTDVVTTQYSWAGAPLVIVQKQEKAGTNAQTTVVMTRYTYDDLNRVVKTEMRQSNTKVNSGAMTAWATVEEAQYNAIGQMVTKKLGRRRTGTSTYSTTALETQVMEYNIRGWLLGVNRAYARDAASTDSTTTTSSTISGESFTEGTGSTVTYPNTAFFGFDLGYDKTNNNLINGKSYTRAQYTGDIAGMVWKSAADQKVRKYDFAYDSVSRLAGAAFGQYASGGFSTSNVNYTVSNLTYDYNSNMLSMTQYGLKTGSASGVVDQLAYTYTSGTNKLLNVSDAVNDPASTLGDFHYAAATKTAATVDYTYDADGNLITDANKKISVTYNFLNLPSVIRVTGKGSIYYTYDAGGSKLRKTVVDSTVLPARKIVTTYLSGVVFRNDTLQFFNTGEGRARLSPSGGGGWVYDYMLKDHLGNTRMVVTDDYNVGSAIVEATSYYPFGLVQQGISVTASLVTQQNKYLYNGKELQSQEFGDGSGLDEYDYGARLQDPQLGVWHNIDPLADVSRRYSPYVYGYNNPVNMVDPDGMMAGPTHVPGTRQELMAEQRQWREDWNDNMGYTGNDVASGMFSVQSEISAMVAQRDAEEKAHNLLSAFVQIKELSVDDGDGNNVGWNPLYKKDLITYYKSINHKSPNENELGDLFENLFETFAKTDQLMRSSNVRRNGFVFKGGFRNTAPDFVGDAFVTEDGVETRIKGADWYELKQMSGGLYLSSNEDQIAGHIDNIRREADYAYAKYGRLGYQSMLYVVTTADVRFSESIYERALKNNVLYSQLQAEYRIINNNWEFRFNKAIISLDW